VSEVARPDHRDKEIGRIGDQQLLGYIEACRLGDSNAREKILEHLRARFQTLKDTQLVQSGTHPQSELEVFKLWNGLTTDARVTAERLWRDNFLQDKTDSDSRTRLSGTRRSHELREQAKAQEGGLRLLCRQSHLLMLLWLETSLYRVRAMSNVRAQGAIVPAQRREESVQGQIGKTVKVYFRELGAWGRELHRATGLRLFGIQYGDAERLRALSKEFGPAKVLPGEAGWVARAADAEAELRYRFFNARLQERRQSGHYLAAATYLFYKFTIGYGRKPLRFALTGGVTIVSFAFLFFLNDYFNPGITSTQHFCPAAGVEGLPWYDVILHYLYLGTTNLSTLGSDSNLATYCGGNSTQMLLVAGTLVGYFLLATLAALLVTQLTEAD
jgi:hypothetical protein